MLVPLILIDYQILIENQTQRIFQNYYYPHDLL